MVIKAVKILNQTVEKLLLGSMNGMEHYYPLRHGMIGMVRIDLVVGMAMGLTRMALIFGITIARKRNVILVMIQCGKGLTLVKKN